MDEGVKQYSFRSYNSTESDGMDVLPSYSCFHDAIISVLSWPEVQSVNAEFQWLISDNNTRLSEGEIVELWFSLYYKAFSLKYPSKLQTSCVSARKGSAILQESFSEVSGGWHADDARFYRWPQIFLLTIRRYKEMRQSFKLGWCFHLRINGQLIYV